MKTILRVVQDGQTTDFDSSADFDKSFGPGTNGLKEASIQLIKGEEKLELLDLDLENNVYVCYRTTGSQNIHCHNARFMYMYGPLEPQEILFYGNLHQCSEWKLYMGKITIPQIIWSIVFMPIALPVVSYIALQSGQSFGDVLLEINPINAIKEMISDYRRTEQQIPY
jgi:hypothetical protein